ncbi:MAG TPA: helix-turn-helix domain-containing protein [Longimicrobium sp.]|nr:helix-turn-helix domain-containing protein [Longimicrobium sp.]
MDERSPDTEQRILDAAHRVFIRKGTAGARMQEIADEAGVNKALLHYYFRSKERLGEAVFQRAFRELVPSVLGTLAADLPIREKVARVIAVEMETLRRAPFLPGYIISELHHHPERVERMLELAAGQAPAGLARPAVDALGRQLAAAAREGTVRPIAPEQFVINLLSLCIFPFLARPLWTVALGWEAARFDTFIDERTESLTGFFLDALRP